MSDSSPDKKCRYCGGWSVDLLEHEYRCVMRPAPPSASGLHVVCGEYHESGGRVTWVVSLSKSPDAQPWECHEIYSSKIEGRARYEADRLKHFLGQGPKPDLLAYDTDAPATPNAIEHTYTLTGMRSCHK